MQKNIDGKTKLDSGGAVERGKQENPPGLGEHGRQKGGGWVDSPMTDPPTPGPQYPPRRVTGP